MYDVIVVGAGIMGATIAEALRVVQGRDVIIIDREDPFAGSTCSGGLIKPSKFTGLGDDQMDPVLDLLGALWGGLKEQTFTIRPSGGLFKANIWRLNMRKVFDLPYVYGKVTQVLKDEPAVILNDDNIMRCEMLVIAAGMGCAELLPDVFPPGVLTAKQGASFLFRGSVKGDPFVKAWAPYKQITVHDFDDETIWASDGSALKPDNWTDDRTESCIQRCMEAMGTDERPAHIAVGHRPFHKSKAKPCYLEEVADDVWVATGAGKFGSISAGWAANQLLGVYT